MSQPGQSGVGLESGLELFVAVLVMAESPAQISSLEASTEAIKLNSSASVTPSPSPAQAQKPVDIADRPITTPNLDSREAFLEFCRLYAPYMQYSGLTDREVCDEG